MGTPVHQAVGLYKLKAPFASDAQATYICESIEGYEALIGEGVDIYVKYYQPLGLTQDDYRRDLIANENIITLISSTADTIYVPSSYILEHPTSKGVVYSHTFITVDCGALPDGLNLNPVIDQIKELTDWNIGISSSARIITMPTADLVSYSTHGNRETARRANIDYKPSLRKQLETTLNENVELRKKIDLLEKELIARL